MEKERDIRKTVLSQMKISGDIKDFLDEITIPIIAEWAYLCAAEGMPFEKLKRACAAAESNTGKAYLILMEERERNLREKYENNGNLKAQYTDLLHRVQIIYERANALEEGLNGKLTEAMQTKDKAFGEMIQTKDKMIRDHEGRISDLKKEISDLKKEAKDLKDENRDFRQKYEGEREKVYSLEGKLKTAEIRLSSFAKRNDSMGSEEGKKELPGLAAGSEARSRNHETDEDKIQVFPYRRYGYSMKRYRGRHSFFNRGDREADEFIRLYIENKDYSEDQKQYLIECLEQGDSLSVIRKFASPNLSVKYMDQLRRILYERGY